MAEQINRLQQTLEQVFCNDDNLSDQQIEMFSDVLYDNGAVANKDSECLFHAYGVKEMEEMKERERECEEIEKDGVESDRKFFDLMNQMQNLKVTHILDEIHDFREELDEDGFMKY